MKKIYVPSRGPDDWRQLLADPCTQPLSGFDATSLAEEQLTLNWPDAVVMARHSFLSTRSGAMSLVCKYRNSRRSSSNPAVLGCLPIFLIGTSIALPSSAEASSSWTTWWWGNFSSYSECVEYYTKHPRGATGWGYSPEEVCTKVQAAQDEKRREQAEMNRVIILSCRAE